MPKAPDEIKKGLECCSAEKCTWDNGCPYGASKKCAVELKADALTFFQQLQAENAEQAERIQQLEAQGPRWIPVEERMPAPHEDVAIIIRLGGYTYLRVGWYGCACQWMQAGLGMIEGEVTHWMPLPETPKEEHGE